MLPLQHPLGHDAASHTHCPVLLLHSWFMPHPAHVAPAEPHDVFDSDAYAWHVPLAPPLQQPAGQVFASHAQVPLVLSHSPLAHELQVAPPLPHCEGVCEEKVTQVLPLQQPLAHEVASHTHCPVVLLHSWPVAHEPHATPPAPHEVFVSDV